MKPQSTLRHSILLAASSLLAVSSSHAADLTWDITPGTVGAGDSAITGGTGTWNTTNGNWTSDAGANNIAWNNATNHTAIFGGTAGTVTLGEPIHLKTLSLTQLSYTSATVNNRYTITGSTLNFAPSGTITVAGTNSAQQR